MACLFKKLFLFLIMYMCVGVMCVGAHRGQKMALDPLELELEEDVSHLM